jgi:hypothetical protein
MSFLAPHRLHSRSRTGRVWHIRTDSDTWGIANILNLQDPADGNTIGPSGYTLLERYLNEPTLL